MGGTRIPPNIKERRDCSVALFDAGAVDRPGGSYPDSPRLKGVDAILGTI